MYSCDLLKSKKKIEFSIIVLHIDTIIQHADILFLDVEKIHLACKGQNNVTIINAFIVISQFLALYILENLKNLKSRFCIFQFCTLLRDPNCSIQNIHYVYESFP